MAQMQCPKCKEKIIQLSSSEHSSYNRPIFLFTTWAVLACITLNSLSMGALFEEQRKSLRNLDEKGFAITGEDIIKETIQ